MTFLSVDAEAIDDKPVVNEYITPQAIAFRHLCLYGNPGSSPGAEECTGWIVYKPVLPECRAEFTDAHLQVLVCIIHSLGIFLRRLHGTSTKKE